MDSDPLGCYNKAVKLRKQYLESICTRKIVAPKDKVDDEQ